MPLILTRDNGDLVIPGPAEGAPTSFRMLRMLVSGHAAAGPLTALGDEDRQKVPDATAAPAAMICSIEADLGQGLVPWATGWLAGPRTVVTAGHVIWHEHRPAAPFAGFRVLPGRDGAQSLGSQDSAAFHLHPRWNAANDFPHNCDIGAIRLPQPFAGISHFGILAASPATLQDRLVNIMGYPDALKDGTPLGKTQMWFHANRIRAVASGQLLYDVDTSAGQSGSPVILWPDPGGLAIGPTVVGVHARGVGDGHDLNKATTITSDILQMVKAWIDADNAA